MRHQFTPHELVSLTNKEIVQILLEEVLEDIGPELTPVRKRLIKVKEHIDYEVRIEDYP